MTEGIAQGEHGYSTNESKPLYTNGHSHHDHSYHDHSHHDHSHHALKGNGHSANGNHSGYVTSALKAVAPVEALYQFGSQTAEKRTIPFNRPTEVGNEMAYMAQSLQSGRISGDGPFTKKCHQLLEETLGVHKALLTTSCTHALEIAALLLKIQPGDEVIVPSFTFVSTINAFVLRGARPVFSDIRPDTLNLDESKLEALITPRTKAIVPVHYGGVGCEMDQILAIANHYGIPVVEDNAHGLYARYKGRCLGAFGVMATQSFHETKNFTCGEGGALLINEACYSEVAEIIREKGTNRSRFFRGQVDKYTWVDVGSSYLPSDLLAAYLYAQLEARQQIQCKRQRLWASYAQWLRPWAEAHGMQLPFVPDHCDQAYHLFYLLMPSLAVRTAFITYLKAQDIQSVFHYLPLHASQMGQALGGRPGDCPVTEAISDRLVRLPFYTDMTMADLEQVVDAIVAFQPGVERGA
ncbi:MAG: dTDP-4-amino-4,6-dideoxygalactose transaminase [Caldilinea sp. CFX5]|nr:dTDP-4-amino-4,6-dideoxygalactose transaminase [Caldilinea sp. CFX5]